MLSLISGFLAQGADPFSTPGRPPELPDELKEYKQYLTVPDLEIPSVSAWDHTLGIRLSSGYDDNVLLSAFNPQGSSFIGSGLDFSLFRMAESGSEFIFWLTADDTRYLDSTQINGQDLVTSTAQLKTEWSENWKSRISLEYTFQDQVVDGSAYAGQFVAVPAQGHTITLRPELIRALGTNYRAELQWIATRQIFDSPLDSYWQSGPRVTLGRKAAFPSDLTLSYEITRVMWDHLTEVDSKGSPIPASHLASWEHKAALRAQQYLDAAHHWSTATLLGLEYSANDGSTYNDYLDWRVAQELAFRSAPWKLNARAAYVHYRFPWEPSSTSPALKRSMDQLDFTLRLERKIGPHFKAFIQAENTQSLGNDASDRYKMNTVDGGIEFEF